MSADSVLDKLAKEVSKKGFDPILDHGSDGEMASVYYGSELHHLENEDDFINYWADELDIAENDFNKDTEDYKEQARKDYEAWDKTDDYPTEGPLFEEALEGYLDDRWNEFSGEFDYKTTFEGSRIELYRCVQVKDPAKFIDALRRGVRLKTKGGETYKGMGIFWSWDEDASECHWGGGGDTLTITALAPLSSIDYPSTAFNNMNPSLGREEKEITLKDGAPITVTKVVQGDEVLFEKRRRSQAVLDMF